MKFYKDKYCVCGCGRKIPIRNYHKSRGISKYINGHFFKGTRKLTDEQISEVFTDYKNKMNVYRLAEKFGISTDTLYALLKFYHISLRGFKRTYELNEKAFDKLTPQAAYWLGFIYADGYLNEQFNYLIIKLQVRDKIVLEEFRKFLKSNYPIRIAKSNELRAVRIFIKSKYLINRLKELGVHQKKTLTLKFPSSLPENFYSDFIRGYFDGDGSLSRSKEFSTCFEWQIVSTKNVIQKMQEILMKYCDLKKTKLRVKSNFNLVLRYGGNKQVRKIAKFLLRNDGFYLERKLGKLFI